MTNIDHGTNLNRLAECGFSKERITQIAVATARYATRNERQDRLSNGRFAPATNSVSALSIAANSGIVFG